MYYKPTIVIDDDNPEILRIFRLKSEKNGVQAVTFESWQKTLEYLEGGNPVDAIVLDARGKIRADKTESDSHILEALKWVAKKKLPYAIYTAFTEELNFLTEEIEHGNLFTKGRHKEEDVFEYLKKQIAHSPKVKYPEPFACFGAGYLEVAYQELLMNVVQVFENEELSNPENMLFNPCRIILEQVFRTINNEAPDVLPGALVNFEDQRVGLVNCSKYLTGIPVRIKDQEYQRRKFLPEHISQQIQTIIAVCHPASHEIQKKYSRYTFQSVLWAIFDVLVWLKGFIDYRKK